ncbi:transcriptional regulator, TetR family [Pseudonocardia oroxyli]|uniref:Transcriptional regulator, TetR family n=1 Tax=Pseudonocardia oroxyli TaxID=366584 RepID=A0A1G7UYY1_PSEOR|nr:transcriptional regulator, TetR family [Pseudonocardia oroxyli]
MSWCVITLYRRPVPRWEQGSEERLRAAALQLFREQGFEDTSVVEIARQARVTNRTFFRYFSDKREVLFADADGLRAALVERLLQVPDVADPLRAVVRVLARHDWEGLAPRRSLRERQAVIAANSELLERDLVKQHVMALGFADALARRGGDERAARVAARVGVQVFLTAYEQWLEAPEGGADLAQISEDLLSTLGSRTAAR